MLSYALKEKISVYVYTPVYLPVYISVYFKEIC